MLQYVLMLRENSSLISEQCVTFKSLYMPVILAFALFSPWLRADEWINCGEDHYSCLKLHFVPATFEATVYVSTNHGRPELLFDMTDSDTFYAIQVSAGDRAWLVHFVEGELVNSISSIPLPPRPETYYKWYQIKVFSDSNQVECYVDDLLLYDGEIELSGEGGVGIGIWNGDDGYRSKIAFCGFEVLPGYEAVLPPSILLDVPQIYQGRGGFCGPASICMVYRYHDIPGSYTTILIGEDIARQEGFACIDANGIFHEELYTGTGVNPMGRYMKNAGRISIVHRKTDTTQEDINLIVQFLKENLVVGRPVICHLPGHYVVVRGYDDTQNVFHVNDPSKGQIDVPCDEFLEEWNNFVEWLHYYMYVFNYWEESLTTKWDAVRYYEPDGSLVEEGPLLDFHINRPDSIPVCSGTVIFDAEGTLVGSDAPELIGDHLVWHIDSNDWFEGSVLHCEDQEIPFSAKVTAVYDYDDFHVERSNTFHLVEPLADLTGEGNIGFQDYARLSAFWLTIEPSVDIAPGSAWDGMIDVWDLRCLLSRWLYTSKD